MATMNPSALGDLFRQGLETFEAAMRSAAKIQEESVRRYSEMFRDWGAPGQWQNRVQETIREAIGITQKNFDEALRVMNENAKTSLELFQKAVALGPMAQPGGAAEAKYHDLWESVLATLRSNTEVVLQANTRLTEAWAELAKKMGGQAEDIARESGNHH